MKHLLNKTVTVHLGTVPGFTDCVKGKVIRIDDLWMTVKTKSTTEQINIAAIKRISEKDA